MKVHELLQIMVEILSNILFFGWDILRSEIITPENIINGNYNIILWSKNNNHGFSFPVPLQILHSHEEGRSEMNPDTEMNNIALADIFILWSCNQKILATFIFQQFFMTPLPLFRQILGRESDGPFCLRTAKTVLAYVWALSGAE
jgi:hypothetical protein